MPRRPVGASSSTRSAPSRSSTRRGRTSIYSDLGFILLGFLAADRGGAPLAELFDRVTVRLQPALMLTTFGLPSGAPTACRSDAADDRRQPPRSGAVGEVHDNYAAALGGVAGHAGLFGSASGVGAFARSVLRRRPWRERPAAALLTGSRPQVHHQERGAGSSRALGWDTMLPTSSCGTRHVAARRSATSATPARRCGSIPTRDRYFVLLDQPRLRRRHARRHAHGAPRLSRCAR